MHSQKGDSRGWFYDVADNETRRIINESLYFIISISQQQRDENKDEVYRLELRRVIILYICSIIEVVLLSKYKKSKTRIELVEYKYIQQLNKDYIHKNKKNCHLVIAVATKREKQEHQIGLYDLVKFFQEENYLNDSLGDKILKINEYRNTLHFAKGRNDSDLNLDLIEDALGVLHELLIKTSRRRIYSKK